MDKKSIIAKVKEIFSSKEEILNFVDVKAIDGKIFRVSDMVEGSEIKEITEDGEVDVDNGTYLLEDNIMLIVEDGKVSEIKEAEELVKDDKEEMEVEDITKEVTELANVMRTDGVAIYYEGIDLVPGETKLFLDEAMTEPAPEGHHLLEGGLIVMIEDGVLVSIDEVPEKEEEVVEEMEVENNPKLTSQLKDLISQMKDLKNSFEEVKKENKELKERVNKFAAQPSEEPIKERINFGKVSKEDKLKFFSKR